MLKSGLRVRSGINEFNNAGLVVGHPENRVRNKDLDQSLGLFGKGYYFSGVTLQVAVQKRLMLGRFIYLTGETKLNLAYARVPVFEGIATVPLGAWHGLLGIGCCF